MRIVIVEDEKSIRSGLARMLPRLSPDYQVVDTAANGMEGLEVIARTRPDLVIMDIQMPEMDGLTMLEQLRKRGVLCRVVVLTAYSDFSYAKRAIELNIENYLLKPIKIPELRRVLESAAKELEQEKGAEKLQERLLSLEQIFRGCILAELPVDEELSRTAMEKYGLKTEEPVAIFSVWLGDHYDGQAGDVIHVLEEYTGRMPDYQRMVIRFSRYQMIGIILYHMENPEKIRQRYEKMALSVLQKVTDEDSIFNWVESENLGGLADAFPRMIGERTWNLSFPHGTVISSRLLEDTQVKQLKYPMELEVQLRTAVTSSDEEQFRRVLDVFYQDCMEHVYHPDEIREVCIRFCMTILNLGKTIGRMKMQIPAQDMIGRISKAIVWTEIRKAMDGCYAAVAEEHVQDAEVSLMVKRARQMIEEYYDQGITLEELAEKLCVSEEYLSTQFKKETGVSFKDTVKKYRIDKIKDLLWNSSLKLNQIADMAGYSDPKYMSRVFKEEVGMLPAEFRKLGH